MYQNPWLTVNEDQVVTPAGADGVYGTVEAKDGVMVIALDGDSTFLLKEYKYPIDMWCIQGPGGGIDNDETPLTGAQRELREEVGVTAATWTPLGFIYPWPSLVDSRTFFFLAEGITQVGQELESTEALSVLKVSLVDALHMVEDGTICDGETITALTRTHHYLASHGRA